MAILDADKEGFLRSTRSLIQTIGRAARNVQGRAILYADNITESMRRAIDETERRRAKQMAHNREHGITPQTICKEVADIMERGGVPAPGAAHNYAQAAEEAGEYNVMSPAQGVKKIRELEKRMQHHARDLEFEQAAKLRDEIKRIEQYVLGGESADLA